MAYMNSPAYSLAVNQMQAAVAQAMQIARMAGWRV